jgi:hypothetical protein
VQELSLCAAQLHAEGLQQALDKLRPHMKEPGVATAVYRVLAQAGLIHPSQIRQEQAPRGETVDLSIAGAAPAPASGLWTPEGAAPPREEKKSSLWLPE